MHTWCCLILFSGSACLRGLLSAGAAVCCFLPDCFWQLSYPFIQGCKIFMTSPLETVFSQTTSCQTLGSPTIFSLKDLHVPAALIYFHLDLIFRSLPRDLCLFKPVLKVLFPEPCDVSGFFHRALERAFLSM